MTGREGDAMSDQHRQESLRWYDEGARNERIRITEIIDRYIDESPDDSQILSYLYNEVVCGSKYGEHDND